MEFARPKRLKGKVKNCPICNNEYYAPKWLMDNKGGKYCSRNCYYTSKKGHTPWNKGTKGVCKPNNTSFKPIGNLFKGTMAEYKNLHYWVSKMLGRPRKCELCKNDKLELYHWANKSGKYLRHKLDWIRLCVKCHYHYDWKTTSIYKTR